MGDFCLSKPDILFERENLHDAPGFVLETFESRNRDPGDIAMKEAFRKQTLDKILTRKTRQDYLNDIIFRRSGKELPADTSPDQRAVAIKQVLDDKNTKLRFVFSIWPRPGRAPDAKPGDPPPFKDITTENSLLAKMTPNGNQFWGATLFDFYFVQRLYDRPELQTISTASKLAKWVKANGEIDPQIKVSLEWAEDEKDPEVITPYDIQVLIQEREDSIRQRIIAIQLDAWDREVQPDICTPLEQWPPKSVFEPEAYPRGWSTDAFKPIGVYAFDATPVLQHYIPQHRLPEKLVVHDPSDLLQCNLRSMTDEDGAKTVIYKLNLSEKYSKRRKADEEKEAEEEAQRERILELFLANPHSSLERPNGYEMVDLKEPGWTKPAVFVVFPPRPSLRRPEEAHVYLSPDYLAGKGNHSLVYHAEMVTPRSWLIHDVMCIECVKDDVKKLLEEEDGPRGERRLKKWDEKTGMVVRQETRKRPLSMMKDWDDIGPVTYVIQDAVNMDVMAYEGPYRVVHTRIEYQNLERAPLCIHLSRGMPHIHPLATKVRLTAKLSNADRNDREMLQNEAYNYQRFPKHFFEHWSGYNACWPITEPVPLGPIVPQFYGYYVPVEKSDTYQSPILLIEQCGKQIEGRQLSVDDRNECLSLVLRMNAAGWLHGSVYMRNMLKQPGPLNESPTSRKMKSKRRNGYGVDWSFRLIDFGRSSTIEESSDEWLVYETNKIRGWWQSGTGGWS